MFQCMYVDRDTNRTKYVSLEGSWRECNDQCQRLADEGHRRVRLYERVDQHAKWHCVGSYLGIDTRIRLNEIR